MKENVLKKIKIQVFDNQSGDFGNATFICTKYCLALQVAYSYEHSYILLTNILNDYDKLLSGRLEGASAVYYTIFCGSGNDRTKLM